MSNSTPASERKHPSVDHPEAGWQHLLLRPRNWPIAAGMALLWLMSLLPFPYNVRLGKVLGGLLYLLPSRRKHITLVNLQLCFPELDAQQRQRFCFRVFENYGAGLVETALAWWANEERLYPLVEISGLDRLNEARAKKRGVLLLGAHFSTLDMGAALAKKFFSYSAVYKPQKNELFNAMMNTGRRRHSLNIFRNSELRKTIRALKHNSVVWYAPDQDMGERHSVFAPFFGQRAASITATAKLAALSDAPVLMFGQYRHADDSGYTLRITGPLENFPSGDDVLDASAVNQLLEESIRVAPEQYYWFHRRFKSQPGQRHGAIYR